MTAVLPYVRAFLVGGGLCAFAQILIDRTRLTPARILVGYVVGGVLLGALGIFRILEAPARRCRLRASAILLPKE